ncbi:MAG TPA: TonB family protein [Terriglobales bacterium]|jgi:TonB family protein
MHHPIQLQPKAGFFERRRIVSLAVSVALHLACIGFVLYAAAPRLLVSSSKVAGRGDKFVTHVYWPNQNNRAANDAVGSGHSAKLAAERARKQLQLRLRARLRSRIKQVPLPLAKTPAEPISEPTMAANQPQAAGSSTGSAFDSTSSDEVRIALPVVSADPFVDRSELGGKQGDVVVEITIDDKGNIVSKQVVKSFSPEIDDKVLAALQNWRFVPATRNGVPISSKQDVHYHFPRQG